MFVCSKCGNSDPRYIGYIKDRPYCRKCITFKGQDDLHKENYPKNASVVLNYELSDEQKDLSSQLLLNYKKGINTLVNAVCGSGKTEIVLEVISYAIRSGEHVAFALPRRDVAIELFERLKNIFKWNKVICVYGGHHDKLEADLIVLTTHQLYRY